MTAIRTYEMDLYGGWSTVSKRSRACRSTASPIAARFDDRTPTAALTIEGHAPRAISEALGREGIATWDGDFYATGLIERLGLAGRGGVVRIGLTHYNTADEVDRRRRRPRPGSRRAWRSRDRPLPRRDVAIVGGGIVGAAAAASWLPPALSVTLYEARPESRLRRPAATQA